MKTSTILVAEDDTAMLDSLRIRLTSEGYEVLCAHDGYQAVALAREQHPDLLILDIHMPAGDGFSVQDRVSKMSHLNRVPIVFVTGDRSQHLLDKAQNVGARSLLRKPFETYELLQLVRESLEESQSSSKSKSPAAPFRAL